MSIFRSRVLLLLVFAVGFVNASFSETSESDDAKVVKAALDSVVYIVVSDSSGREIKSGSGFIATNDGKIVTNYHVVKGGHSAVVKLRTGAFFNIEGVISENATDDIAVLKVAGSGLTALPLGDSASLVLGEKVVAIGSPLGLQNSVSDGIVSGIRNAEGRTFIQTTAPASPGNSGGPLLNLAGQVVGIVTFKLVGGENLNFAVPIDAVKTFLMSDARVRPLDQLGTYGASERQAGLTVHRGESLYVVSSNLEIQRKAEEEFKKINRFSIVKSLTDAHLVFAVIVDQQSRDLDEVAFVLLPSDYRNSSGDLDSLRNIALWQSENHFHRGKNAALAGATLGYSALFHHPSVVKGLVEQFHHDLRCDHSGVCQLGSSRPSSEPPATVKPATATQNSKSSSQDAVDTKGPNTAGVTAMQPAVVRQEPALPAFSVGSTVVGTVSVTSNPDGAEIFVDSVGHGHAPALLNLSPGKHTVQLVMTGYKDWSGDVLVKGDSIVNVTANLEK